MKTIVYDKPEIVGPWVCERMGGTYSPADSVAFGLFENGEVIAGIIFDNYQGGSIAGHVAGEPGKRWLTREFLHMCFGYPFLQLKVNVLIGLVDSTNLEARKFDEHCGFKLSCTIPKAARNGDLLIYTMTADECRFLKAKA